MTIAFLAASRLGDGYPRLLKCRAGPYIAGSKLVTHTKTQLEAQAARALTLWA